MYKVFIKTHFSSAHYLRNYPGNCEYLHGHNWEVTVSVKAKELNEIDVAIDFRDLKKIVAEIMDELDHKNLNELPQFREINPSSERLARYIYERLEDKLRSFAGISPVSVEVKETPTSGVEYFKD